KWVGPQYVEFIEVVSTSAYKRIIVQQARFRARPLILYYNRRRYGIDPGCIAISQVRYQERYCKRQHYIVPIAPGTEKYTPKIKVHSTALALLQIKYFGWYVS